MVINAQICRKRGFLLFCVKFSLNLMNENEEDEQMRKIISSLLLMAVLVLCSAVAFAQGRVQVDGMATIHNNLIDIARDKAIDNAQRNAVEKVVGVMITSSTEVENFQLKLDRILSESKGFINDY